MYQGQVGAFFECPDARSCCGLMHTTSSTYLRVPFPHPSARCVKHSTQLCSCQLPAGSICFSLRTVRETWNTPALIPSYNLSHVTSFSHYLCTLQREDLFFLSLSERVLSIFSYMVTSTAWDLIGKLLWLVFHWPLRKPFHRELQQMLPVQIRSIQGIVLSLQSLSHIFLWEGLGEGHQFAASHYKTIWEVAITNIFSSLG